MTTIRIGNDIDVLWKIYSRNGEKYFLDDSPSIKLWLLSGPFKKEITDFDIVNRNMVSFTIDADDITRLGIYKLELSILDVEAVTEDATIDVTEVFQIVSKVYQDTNDNILDGGNVVIMPATILNNIVSSIHEGTAVAPDDEDITIEDDLLRFKNRGTEHGLGYVILRRDKTFAEQVTQENTIYEIRYDFDLNQKHTLEFGDRTFNYDPSGLNIPYVSTANPVHLSKGESIWIPDSCEYFVSNDGTEYSLLMDVNSRKCVYTADDEINLYIACRTDRGVTSAGCFFSGISLPNNTVLKFVGGTLKDGLVVGNSTVIDADGVQIFNNVVLSNFDLSYIDARWYGLTPGYDISDTMQILLRTYNQHIGVPIKLYGKYRIDKRIDCRSGIVIWNDYMSPDVFGEKIYPGHEQKPLAEITVKAGVTAFNCAWLMRTTLGPSIYAPLGTTAFRGIKFVADAPYDDQDNPTVVVRQAITANPPRGFKIQDCSFSGFGNAILCDYAIGNWGSVMSNVLIENCLFRNCDYAMMVDKRNDTGGELMINGLEMVRCTLDRSKLKLIGLYGVNRISQIVINGASASSTLVDPVYIRMKYGTLELDQWYMEYLSGDFSIIGESGFTTPNSNYYDKTTAVEIRNWYTMQNSFESDATHPNLKLQNVSVKSLPDLLPKGNIFFDCASIDRPALEQRIYDAVRLPSIVMTEETSGISHGCIVVKTDEYSVATVSSTYIQKDVSGDLGYPLKLFRGYFSTTGGTIYRKDIVDNLYIRNFGPSQPSTPPTKEMSLTNLVSPTAVFVDSTYVMLSFYKYRGAFRIRLKDSSENTIGNIRTPYNPGVCLILLSGSLSSIVSLSVTQAGPVDTVSVELGVIGVRQVFPSGLDYSTSILQHCIVLNPDAPRTVGTYAERPKGYNDFSPDSSFRRSGLYTGFEYFATDLGKPIYAVVTTTTVGGYVRDIVNWVDATGESV